MAEQPGLPQGQRDHPLPTLIGREREVQLVRALLGRPEVRLLTLHGPGGIGKTALATHLAPTLQAEYDAVLFVDLTTVQDAHKVLDVICTQLPEPSHHYDPLERIAAFAGDRRVLVILDNFEHVVDAAVDVAHLLAAAPTLRLLVTSRVALQVHAEHEVDVGPLSLPGDTRSAEQSMAVRLFVQRAQQVDANFELSGEARDLVTRIATRLEGVPLAIELAASRLRTFSLVDLAARLDHPLDVLKADFRDRPQRLRSLRAALQWSYDLLGDEDRAVFECCAVFEGSFTPEALEAVWGGPEVLDCVGELLERSVLGRAEGEHTRYRMLQPLRELALERLASHPLAETWRERHARHYAAVAQALQRESIGVHEAARDRYRGEWHNIRSSMMWATERRQTELALSLFEGFARLVVPFGRFEEGMTLCQRVLELLSEGQEEARLQVLSLLISCLAETDRDEVLEAVLLEYATLSRVRGHERGELFSLLMKGRLESRAGRYELAVEANEALMRRCERLLSVPPEQRPHPLTDAFLHDRWGQAMIHAAIDLLELGQYERASEYLETAKVHKYAAGNTDIDWRGRSETLDLYTGQYASCTETVMTQLRTFVPRGLWRMVHHLTCCLAQVEAAVGHDVGAVRLAAFASVLYRTEAYRAQKLRLERMLDQARSRLGVDVFEQAWQEGTRLCPNDVLQAGEALLASFQAAGPPKPSIRQEALVSGHDAERLLTNREREVLYLVAQGHPDRKVALLLNISAATVSKHVGNMLSKLGLHNRVELARWATDQQFRR